MLINVLLYFSSPKFCYFVSFFISTSIIFLPLFFSTYFSTYFSTLFFSTYIFIYFYLCMCIVRRARDERERERDYFFSSIINLATVAWLSVIFMGSPCLMLIPRVEINGNESIGIRESAFCGCMYAADEKVSKSI